MEQDRHESRQPSPRRENGRHRRRGGRPGPLFIIGTLLLIFVLTAGMRGLFLRFIGGFAKRDLAFFVAFRSLLC